MRGVYPAVFFAIGETAMAKSGKKFFVDTHPSKEVVVSGLTRDLTVEACIFDLLDNSIDAARDTIFKKANGDSSVTPDSFAGFKIELTLNGDFLKIEDNCGGIAVADLKSLVLRFGKGSKHKLGIGAFGVGLNRALFKLGKVSHLATDNGKQRAELVLRTDEYLNSPSWELPAEEFQSTGKIGTAIEIRQLPEEIAHQFADRDWVEGRRHEIGQRYARFIAKRLSIKINGKAAVDEEVKLREDGPYEGEYKFYKTKDGVSIHVEYGQHADHRFSKEPDYNAERNKEIVPQYGWNILCNDRAILIADTSDKTGWESFHTEFYGFTGFVRFVSADPSLLPWTTTKMDVDLNNHAYRMALKDMRHFAAKWRSIADQRKKISVAPRPLPPKPKLTPSKPTPTKPTIVKKAKPTIKKDHNQFRTVLPSDVDERHCNDKHLRLVHEAKTLDLAELTYSGLALIRMLFESSVVTYMNRHKQYEKFQQFAIARRRKSGLSIKVEDESKVTPTVDEMLPYLDNNPEVWGAAKQNHLKHSVKRMAAHQQLLNSAVHNVFQQINASKAFEIRDEVLPMLRHLIED